MKLKKMISLSHTLVSPAVASPTAKRKQMNLIFYFAIDPTY
jgi:hypothetical protein